MKYKSLAAGFFIKVFDQNVSKDTKINLVLNQVQ